MYTKQLSLILFGCLMSFSAICQIKYEYDNSGNRIIKKYEVFLRSAEITQDSAYSKGPVIAKEATAELSVPQLEETFGSLEVKVYPNPAAGTVYLELNRLPDGKLPDIELWSPAGRLIAKTEITGEVTGINLRGKPAGVYIVKTILARQVFNLKIIKE